MIERFRTGWGAELHQTGGECSQTIPSGQVCLRISKSFPVSEQRPPTEGERTEQRTGESVPFSA